MLRYILIKRCLTKQSRRRRPIAKHKLRNAKGEWCNQAPTIVLFSPWRTPKRGSRNITANTDYRKAPVKVVSATANSKSFFSTINAAKRERGLKKKSRTFGDLEKRCFKFVFGIRREKTPAAKNVGRQNLFGPQRATSLAAAVAQNRHLDHK